jgi:hypothetical protein
MARPYDGRTHLHRDGDADPTEGHAIVCRVLGLATTPDDVRYELELHSGGIGIVDRLAISFPAMPARIGAIVMKLSGGLRDDEDLRWLLDVDEGSPLDPLRSRSSTRGAASFSRRATTRPTCGSPRRAE